jgi:hypothetical protein
MKNLKLVIPELFLIISIIYYWTLTANILNPVAIALLTVMIYQITSKKAISGMIISAIFIFLNLYMVLALISELSEFETVTDNYNNLLIVGTIYIGLNLVMGTFMFLKYIKLKIN